MEGITAGAAGGSISSLGQSVEVCSLCLRVRSTYIILFLGGHSPRVRVATYIHCTDGLTPRLTVSTCPDVAETQTPREYKAKQPLQQPTSAEPPPTKFWRRVTFGVLFAIAVGAIEIASGVFGIYDHVEPVWDEFFARATPLPYATEAYGETLILVAPFDRRRRTRLASP